MSHFDEMDCIYGRNGRDCCRRFPCTLNTPPKPITDEPQTGGDYDQARRDAETARANAEERERCAKVIDARYDSRTSHDAMDECEACAGAIRALAEKGGEVGK